MTLDTVLEALALPQQAMLGHRVPKTLLIEHGAPTAADRRHIENSIDELRWVAALKPTTIGVASYSDDTREVLELAVLTLRLKPALGNAQPKPKLPRLVELIHRAIPYHLLLISEPAPGTLHLSLSDKRWAHNERDKVVLDGNIVTCDLLDHDECIRARLLESLSLVKQPRTNLYALYRGWLDAVFAAQAARLTGSFAPAESPQRAEERREALKTCAALESTIASVRAAAAKEKQVARQVELNLELKTLRAQYEAARQQL